jgi:hypothetical protein
MGRSSYRAPAFRWARYDHCCILRSERVGNRQMQETELKAHELTFIV